VPQILQGSIIRATVTDTIGANPKARPLIVISGNPELSQSDAVICVAITSGINDPPLQDEVVLPWHPEGRCRTKLKTRCGAKCSWIREVRKSAVLEVKGHCPRAELEMILDQVGKLAP
jgi:mRNA-degrading endonuclease toxin of MazEF toxin-antitoxin module